MSHQHRTWRPSAAPKPSHLRISPVSPSVQSLAALQGATTAFTSSPKNASSTRQQLRSQHTSSDIGGEDQEQDGGIRGGLGQRSPSRGRLLSPQDIPLAGARSITSSTSPPFTATLDRSPSTIAARLASANTSPVRSGATNIPPAKRIAKAQTAEGNEIESNGTVIKSTTPAEGRQSHRGTRNIESTNENPDFKITRHLPSTTTVRPGPTAPRERDGQIEKSPPISRVADLVPISVPTRQAVQPPHTLTGSGALPDIRADPLVTKSKPPTPAPRRGRGPIRNPLQAQLTGPRQEHASSRDEAINRMADAMVASSLASTRTPSPTKAATGRSMGRRSASAHNVHSIASTEPAPRPVPYRPQRPLKQTLRKSSADDEDDTIEVTKRGRRHLVRKHPNMHHEGDRKRWRDKVSETERKRYEGVFAANRGLLLKSADPRASPSRLIDPTSESNQVVNVVVRDIWERSRLPLQVLEQVYDLVAPDEVSLLNREQFVVGLWLIDQKLKGRKLPVRVSESVWASVRHSQGIKISSRS